MTTTPTVEQLVQDSLLTTSYSAGYCRWHDDDGMPFIMLPARLQQELDWFYDEADPDWMSRISFTVKEDGRDD